MRSSLGSYVIVIADGREVYYTHGDRTWMFLLGKFNSQQAARQCALKWQRATGRSIVYR